MGLRACLDICKVVWKIASFSEVHGCSWPFARSNSPSTDCSCPLHKATTCSFAWNDTSATSACLKALPELFRVLEQKSHAYQALILFGCTPKASQFSASIVWKSGSLGHRVLHSADAEVQKVQHPPSPRAVTKITLPFRWSVCRQATPALCPQLLTKQSGQENKMNGTPRKSGSKPLSAGLECSPPSLALLLSVLYSLSLLKAGSWILTRPEPSVCGFLRLFRRLRSPAYSP